MLTYQDLQAIVEDEKERMAFVYRAIMQHKTSDDYGTAKVANDYYRHRNTTITQYQKLLYTVSGQAVPDNWSASYKLTSNFFKRFVTQEVQYLLGNGTTWNGTAAERLGVDFDNRLQEAAKKALIGAVSFGFFNLDHVEVFSLLEFVPLYDEENGALSAGVRFWQIDPQKPLRATLYEIDGYTEYIWRSGEGEILQEKRPYKINISYSESDGLEIFDGENYPTFPIVPLWGNHEHQSEIVGLREQIDAYDLIKSGACDTIDEASMVYWTISNAGGMDDIDLAQFVQKMKTVRAAAMGDGQSAEAHSIDVPVTARETILDRLRKDLYKDYMALDVEAIAGGAITATQIKANYEPLNSKADEFEYCVLEFIRGVLAVAGIEDEPTFTRSVIVNQTEEVQTLISAGEYLDQEYVTSKILTILGDADQIKDVLKRMSAEETIDLTEEPEQEEPQEEEAQLEDNGGEA